MRVAHVELGMKLYGGAFQVKLIIEGLKNQGIDNVLICAEGSDIARHFANSHCAVFTLPCAGDLDLRLLPRIARVLRQTRADLVHLHSRRGADVMGALAARMARCPSVLSRRVDNPESPLWCRFKYGLVEQVISISEAIRQVLLSQGVAPEHVTCVRSALASEYFAQVADTGRVRALLPQAEGKRIIGMLAQFIPRKGHHLLLDALPTVIAAHPDVHFALFGKGRLQAEIAERIEREGLQAHASTPGFVADIERVLPAFYALVHPAYREGLGVSLLQASAAGVPIVACAAGGIVEAVKEGVNGYLVPPGQSAALAERLNALLAAPQLRQQLSASGQDFVRHHFSPETMVLGNLAVYRQVLSPE